MTDAVPRILVVEDDPDIAGLLGRHMRKAGFEVEVQASGREALRSIEERPPDLVILDWMLPDVPGPEVCRIVLCNEKTAGVGIVMLTARDEESDRIMALDIGVDKYFRKSEIDLGTTLVAEIRALLRRVQRRAPVGGVTTYGPIAVDTDRHLVTHGGEEVGLTAKEFLLLQYLLTHRGRVLSRDALLRHVWELTYTGGTRTVDVHVRRLREKLPVLAGALVTVKQFGYKLLDEPPGSAD
jgi:DNA-binding response OmpR family regulator